MTDFEEIESLWKRIEDEDDVGQKRYLMYQVLDLLIEKAYELNDSEVPEVEERISELQNEEGYIYKLSQDFLTSSSTMEKEQKLEKLRVYLEGKE